VRWPALDLARFGEKNENWPVVVLLANRRIRVEADVEEASAVCGSKSILNFIPQVSKCRRD
jgi:hypothetical protein